MFSWQRWSEDLRISSGRNTSSSSWYALTLYCCLHELSLINLLTEADQLLGLAASSFDMEEFEAEVEVEGRTNAVPPMADDVLLFEQSDFAGTFQLDSFEAGDRIAPDCVRDLRLIPLSRAECANCTRFVTFQLEWTSVGDDAFQGTGILYTYIYFVTNNHSLA